MAQPSFAATQEIELVRVNFQAYRNVVIQNKTATHIFFKHAEGIASVKIKDLSSDALHQFGMGPEPPGPKLGSSWTRSASNGTNSSLLPITIPPEVIKQTEALTKPFQEQVMPVVVKMLVWVVAFTVLGHLFCSFCFMMICQKAGKPGGFMVWVPLFQWIPLFKAAGMSGWNLLLLFLPIVNMIIMLVWCIKLAQALQKHPLIGVMLFLPITNIIALLYLAFAQGPNDEEAGPVIKLDFAQSTPE